MDTLSSVSIKAVQIVVALLRQLTLNEWVVVLLPEVTVSEGVLALEDFIVVP